MRPRHFGWIAFLALAAGGAGAAGPAHDPLLAELGAPLFERHCAVCHGVDARGEGPAAPALRTPPPDLTAIASRRDGEFPSAIARFIDGRFEVAAHGPREMPVWGRRFGADVADASVGESIARGHIAALVEYLKSVQEPPLEPAPEPDER